MRSATTAGPLRRPASAVLVRPVEPSDRRAIADAFAHLSAESRYMRFLSHRERLSADELRY